MVLRVVAEPAQIFLAPVLPAAANILLNVSGMLFFIILFNTTPIPFFITSIIGHGLLAGWSARDPHLSTLMTAWMETRRKTSNLLRVKGNKYAP
jgi:hypothetical protein